MSEFGLFVIRVTGMIMFILGFIEIPDYINFFFKSTDAAGFFDFLGIVFLPVGVSIFTGILLIVFPISIANILIPKVDQKIIENDFLFVLNDRLIIIGLGLYVLIESVSDIIFHVASILVLKSSVTGGFPIDAYNYPTIIASFSELLFATLIINKSEYISLEINKKRN